MNRILSVAAALICGLNMSAQNVADENGYSEDFLKPVEKSSVEVVEAYCDSLQKLFVSDRAYDFFCVIMPSNMNESCLAYDRQAGELICMAATEAVWGAVRDGADVKYSSEQFSVKVPEAVGTGLSTLVMLATESSALYEAADNIVLDGITYRFTHSNGITAECQSPRNGNCRQLADMVNTICELVRDGKPDDIVRLLPSVYGLINGFLQVMPGRTLE